MLNRLAVGRDGKTAYERNNGKVAKVMGFKLGEAILWRRETIGNHLGKMTCL